VPLAPSEPSQACIPAPAPRIRDTHTQAVTKCAAPDYDPTTMERIGAMLGGRIFQIAMVVSDLDAALRRSTEIFGQTAWRCYVFGPVGNHRYHDRPTSFSARLALNDATPQMELIEPLEGDSIHRDWLAAHGEGLHHIGVIVPSVEQATASMEALGCPAIQAGESFGAAGDGAYAYYDATAIVGLIVEAVEPPSDRGLALDIGMVEGTATRGSGSATWGQTPPGGV
jgi:methylmalonyl-CoA/ethylmalonyl-CoA epimerase